MSEDRIEVEAAPTYFVADPLARSFPTAWKDIWFRRKAARDEGGHIVYTCPICLRFFDHRMIGYLQGDHIWPYSLFGETSWNNYQLICGACNASKNNRLDNDIRRSLGGGEFRSIVRQFLRTKAREGALKADLMLESIVGNVDENGD